MNPVLPACINSSVFGNSHLIATEPEQVNGVYSGRVVDTPSFREGKIVRLHEWLARLGKTLDDFDQSWFYSDSLNDLRLLDLVTNPGHRRSRCNPA